MKNVFKYNKTECCLCHTPLAGARLHRNGDKFYCSEHWQKVSIQELQSVARTKMRAKKIAKLMTNHA